MTTNLEQELIRIADAAPTYDVLDAALAQHRRRRFVRAAVGSAAAVVALLALAALTPGVLQSGATLAPTSPASAEPSLPRSVDLPPIWVPSPQDVPAGPAALLFSGVARPLQDGLNEANVAVVGATSDTYRLLRLELGSGAGEDTLLSPDGGQVAYTVIGTGSSLRVLDLRTGRTRAVPTQGGPAGDYPAAWSPDGRTLAVRRHTDTGDKASAMTLGLVDVATGRFRELPGATDVDVENPLSLTAAFSPDGAKIAYQVGDEIRLSTVDGRPLATIKGHPTYRLAGKGAWTRDGTALAAVDRAGCCNNRAEPGGARVVLVGVAAPHAVTRSYDGAQGASGIHILGWRPDGTPLAVAHYADPSVTWGEWSYGPTRRIEVVTLHENAPATALLSPPVGVTDIDVADRVVAGGRTRPGAEAPWWPVQTGWLIAAVLLPVLLVLLCAGTVVAVRLLRRWARPRPAGTPE